MTTKTLLFVVALALAVPAMAASTKERTGKAVRIKGGVRYSTDNGKVWQPLKVGTELKAGTIVQTAKDSYVDVVLGDSALPAPKPSPPGALLDYQPVAQRDVVRVMEDSVLSFDKLTMSESGSDTVTETQCDLKSGRLFFTVKKMSAASRFEVKIPNGVAGIRGTIGMLAAEGTMAILSGSGVLAYSKADGSLTTQVVPGGYLFDARSNELTKLPKTMEGGMSSMSQQCYYPGGPPPHPPHPIHHYSPHKPK